MSTEHLVPPDLRAFYHVREWRNAAGVLSTACPEEWADMIEVLRAFRLLRSEVLTAGGGLSPISQQVNGAFDKRGWKEKKFTTLIKVDDAEYASPTHAVDCFKGRVALELEWNNKDPFLIAISITSGSCSNLGQLLSVSFLTRASELQGIFDGLGKGKSYGNSTTHHAKLWPRLEGGGGGGCPVLTFAIKPALYVDDGGGARSGAPSKGRAGCLEKSEKPERPAVAVSGSIPRRRRGPIISAYSAATRRRSEAELCA